MKILTITALLIIGYCGQSMADYADIIRGYDEMEAEHQAFQQQQMNQQMLNQQRQQTQIMQDQYYLNLSNRNRQQSGMDVGGIVQPIAPPNPNIFGGH